MGHSLLSSSRFFLSPAASPPLPRGIWGEGSVLGRSTHAGKTPLPGSLDAKAFGLLSFQISARVNTLGHCGLGLEPSPCLRRKVLGGAKTRVLAAQRPTVSLGPTPTPADMPAGDQLVRGGSVTLGVLDLLAQQP